MQTKSRHIVLVHGLWVTPASWEPFRHFFEEKGHVVLAPAWPGVDGSVEAIRADPSSLHGVGAGEVLAHFTRVIEALPEPPIIMGHSYGGLITQMLIDRGLGCAGVAIDPVPPKGILLLPLSTNRALVPAFLRPETYKGTFLFTFNQWWKVFANTLSEAEARAAYEAQAIPAPGRAIFQAALANVAPGAVTRVDFRNPRRAPLLFIGGEKDVIMPAALTRKIFHRHQASPSLVEYREFPGRSHYIIAETGWQEVAGFALAWAEQHARG